MLIPFIQDRVKLLGGRTKRNQDRKGSEKEYFPRQSTIE